MTHVEGMLLDLDELTDELVRLTDELRHLPGPLGTAVDAAWATSAAYLGARPALRDDLISARRRAGEAADAVVRARQELARAGGAAGNGEPPWLAASLRPGAPAVRLLAANAIGSAAAQRMRQWLTLSFHGRGLQPGPAPYVVSTRSETYSLRFKADAAVTFVREELSDGRVRITELTDTSIDHGEGLGAACTLMVDGHTVFDEGFSLSAGLALNGTTGMTWLFDDIEAADVWWREHRRELRTGVVTRLLPGAGPLWDIARRLGGLWPGAGRAALEPDETFEQVATTASLGAEVRSALGSVGAEATDGVSLRHNDDGTVTVTVHAGGSATASAGSVPLSVPWQQGWVGGGLVAAFTIAAGAVTKLVLQTTTWNVPGLRLDLLEALRAPAAAAASSEDLHAYQTTVVLDLGNPVVRQAVAGRLGVDLQEPTAQLRAALQALTLDERLLDLAEVTVIEQTSPDLQLWRADCSISLPVLSASGGVVQGISTQHTVQAWEKPVGSLGLVRVL